MRECYAGDGGDDVLDDDDAFAIREVQSCRSDSLS